MPGTILLEDAQKLYTERLQQHAQDAFQAIQQANEPPLRNTGAPALPNPQIDSNVVIQNLQQHAQDAWQAVQQANQPPLQNVQVDPNDIAQRLQQHAQNAFQAVDSSVVQPITTGLQQAVQPVVQQVQAAAQTVGQAAQDANQPPLQQNAVQPSEQVDSSSHATFVSSLQPYADKWSKITGIPSDYLMAWAASESNWGKAGNALFGIKQSSQPGTASGLTSGTWEQGVGPTTDVFANYNSPDQAFQALDQFLQGSRYRDVYNQLRGGQITPDQFMQGINAAGYATDPIWSQKIGQIAENSIQPLMDKATGVVQGAQQVVSGAVEQGKATLSTLSQFGDKQLTAAEAYAACGPAAAVRFAQMFGRNPTLREAVDLARSVGWTQDTGMAGLQSESKLFDDMGIPHRVVGADWQALQREAQSGNPVTISTPGHYFTADSYDPKTGAFHVGSSGTDLRGGSEWMTPAQMEQRMGPLQGGLAADNPGVPGRSPISSSAPSSPLDQARQVVQQGGRAIQGGLQQVDAAVQGAVSGATQAIGGATSAAGGLASDLGTRARQTAQDVGSAVSVQNAATNPLMPSNVLSAGEQALGRNVVGPAIGALLPGGALEQGRQALGSAVAGAIPDVPVLGGVARAAGGIIGAPSVLDQMQTMQDLIQKYGQGRAMPNPDAMTAEDRDRWNSAQLTVAGMIGEPGGLGPKTGEGMLAGALDQLGVYPENISGSIRAWATSVDAPASRVASTIQRWISENPARTVARAPASVARTVLPDLETSLRGGGGPYLPGGAQPGQWGFESELPVGGARPSGTEVLGPSGPQAGQLGFESELPVGGVRPVGTEPVGPAGRQPGQLGLGIGEQYQRDLAPPGQGEFQPPPVVPTPVGPTVQQVRMVQEQRAVDAARAARGLPPEPPAPVDPSTMQAILQNLRQAGVVAQDVLPGTPAVQSAARGPIAQAVDLTKQSILSNPATHIANVIGNTIELARQPLGFALGGRPQDAMAGITAVGRAIPEAAQNALAALRGNQLANLSQQASSGGGPIFRALGASDAFTRTLGEYQGMAAEANRLLRQAGIAADDPSAAQYLARHAADLYREGARAGAQSVFGRVATTEQGTGVLDNIFRSYSNAKEGFLNSPRLRDQAVGALMDFGIPFSGVPVQMLQIGLNRLPVTAQASGAVRAIRAMRAGNMGQAQRAVGDTVLESALQLMIAKNVADGNITGPDDPDHPNSVRVGGNWVSMNEWGAYALPMQIMASFADGYSKGGQDVPGGSSVPEYYGPRFAAALNASLKPFQQGIPGENLIRLVSNIGQGGATAGALGLAQDAVNRITVPGAARFVENLTDPVARDINRKGVESLWQGTMANWPGLAQQLPAKIDPTTGEVLNKARTGLGILVGGQQDVASPLTIEANRLNKAGFKDVVAPKAYPQEVTIGGSKVSLSPDEQREVAQITGNRLDQLASRLDSAEYKNAPDARKALMVKAMISAADSTRVSAVRRVLGAAELRSRVLGNRQVAGQLVNQAEAPDVFAGFNPTGEHVMTQRAMAGVRG